MKNRLRITGGILKGRNVFIPEAISLRPVTEKIRQSFFERIKQDLNGQNFVDAFAGSGIMGFEVLSRGADHAILEAKPEFCSAIHDTIHSLGYRKRATVICGEYLKNHRSSSQIVISSHLLF